MSGKTLQPIPNPHPDHDISFRNEGHFLEDVTNRILKDFVEFAPPRKLQVIGKFSVRGGIFTTVRAEYEQPN